MRPPAPTPTDSALPLAHPDDDGSPRPEDPALANAAVARFNDLLHELYPDAPHVDGARLLGVAHWLQSLPRERAEALLQARLARLEELRALLADPDWDADEALRTRLDKLLAYVGEDDDLIPDRVPLLGLLDDALLVELAWPMFFEESEDYRDYCQFRDQTRSHDRADWIATRLLEATLWRHQKRVRESPYADHAPLRRGFKID